MKNKNMTLLALALAVPLSLKAETNSSMVQVRTYQAVKIIDGDTFDATDGNIKFRVRIAGMDAPEKGSAFSKLATVELKDRIEGKALVIQPVGRKLDLYNRVLAQVIVEGQDVGETLIGLGLATYYRPGCVDYPENAKKYDYDPRVYVAAEARARSQKLYFWSDPKPVLPCQVRRDKEQ